MDPVTVLAFIALGGLLGAIGQGVRAVVGIKKMLDAGTMDDFRWPILGVSLLIGFVAGALAMIGLDVIGSALTKTAMLGVVGAGYVGADFIEGFMRRSASQ